MINKVFFALPFFFIPRTVYIYAGPGASENSLIQTEKTLKFFLKSNYCIKRIFPPQIIAGDWEKNAALFVIPGGADIPYTRALNGVGNRKIRAYVEKGGAFLGICAGGYYGGNFVDFAKGTDLEVFGERELSFFPGTVRGPVLAPYDYLSTSGARAAKIIRKGLGTLHTVYYNGGGYFVDAGSADKTTVLASYDAEESLPAIVECLTGSGKAILSGVHFECDPDFLDGRDEHLKEIIPDLKNENQGRMRLVRDVLTRLNIQCRSFD